VAAVAAILVVEDQAEIREMVAKYMEHEGYECTVAHDGFQALRLFHQLAFDLVILDVMMPGMDGIDVLKTIRTMSDIPVIMLTAKQEEVDRLRGFDHGADDYVGKPFSVKELVRRVRVILKRATAGTPIDNIYQYAGIKLLADQMLVLKDGEEILLTAAEIQLLKVFLQHIGQVLSREQLMTLAFGDDYDGTDRNIDSHIKRIRQKIEFDPAAPEYLHTKYGAGYMFGGKRP
jgi:DNA-binding response OmpR family regulator